MAEEFNKILNKWGADQIAEAIAIIENSNASNTGNLINSLRFEVKEDANGLRMLFFQSSYADFVRLGVKGSISSVKAPNSPFSFKDKMPPASPIDKWVVKKGISGIRNKKGQFIKRKSLVFLIRRSIFRFGIRPLNFYAPFFKNINDLQGQITEQQKKEILLLLTKAFEK